jgi:predicted nucleic-acid-binding Zn-ribbon protein
MTPVDPRCPNCGGANLYRSEQVSSGTGYAPNYLPGLGGFLHYAQFVLVACADCGLTRFFADQEAAGKIPQSDRWKKL